MQDGTKREVVSWKLSATLFWWLFVILNVFVCNMLLKNACNNHQNYVRKTDENDPKMIPKPLQNRSWRGSGGLLGATLETRCFQDLIFDDFGSILGPPLGPVWGHCGHNFFDSFLKWFFDSLGLHLGSQNTSKMRPKRGSKSKHVNHWFWCYLLHFGHIQGCWKWWFVCVFLEPCFGMFFEAHFNNFGSLLGSFFELYIERLCKSDPRGILDRFWLQKPLKSSF